MDSNFKKPSWAPSWFPNPHSTSYVSSLLQLAIVLLAVGYLFTHLLRGKVNVAASTAAGAG